MSPDPQAPIDDDTGEIAPEIPGDAVEQSWVDALPLRFQPWLRLMRLDRPIGTWLLFWPSVFGLLLGAAAQDRSFTAWNDFYLLILFGIGAIVMRGAGCTFNDIVDRKIDAKVARTRARPIASGAISVKAAFVFLAVQCAVGLAILVQLNRFSIVLGAASLVLIAAYPFMKRITWWPQAWLGLTFNWGALLGFAAQTGHLTTQTLLLYAGCFFWTLGYDTIYAHQDADDDALIGVKSTARLFGHRSPVWIQMFYVAAFALILLSGWWAGLGFVFAILMLAAGAHLAWQVNALDVDRPLLCLKLFRSNREAGALIAAALLLAGFVL